MRFSNAAFDSLFTASLSETNDSLRYTMYQEMENLMLEESPVILLYYDKILRLIQSNIDGFYTNALNMLYLKEVVKR